MELPEHGTLLRRNRLLAHEAVCACLCECVHTYAILHNVDQEELSHKVTFDQGPQEDQETRQAVTRAGVACSEVPRHMSLCLILRRIKRPWWLDPSERVKGGR